MEIDSKAWTGREAGSKSYPSVTELIDKYLPRKTQNEVYAMSRVYEARITDLMRTIHDYHLRCEAMANHMDGMEKEYYGKVAIPVSYGLLESDMYVSPMDMTRTIQVEWRPDPQRLRYVMRDDYRINEQDTPHLYETVCRQFEERLKAHLIPKLRAEFGKLYAMSRR
ncbi:hypothetical protein FJ420_01875 [Mesorhizobium sp. B3-1-3]|uniref:hypothetical protein n=1 Tax=unclassified Mesorhizobium TaxID=325217 RepID=UPI0011272482|nr:MULTISPECIES: hypothetical protein [unclassified Mesorhizobium]TPI67585.1 hypothetical protein FJ424_09845 [Mesorhizobium sp. B3-1-8]TPI75631.1 hypothetical protein FJ420_01875 [Mesorhizobium sp. B3-1-3]